MKVLLGALVVGCVCVCLSTLDPGPSTASAGCRVVLRSRGSFHHDNNVVVLKQVVADQYYSVGAAIQEEALADRIAAKVEARLLARGAGSVQASDAPPDPQPADHGGLDAITQRACVRCHNPQHPERLDLTLLSALSCEERMEAVRRVVSDDPGERMPKGAELQPGEIGSVLQELSR